MTQTLAGGEAARLETLHQFQILDTDPEASFDALAQLAADLCEAPIALVSLVDRERQWFKAKVGLDVSETSRRISFCAHAILQTDVFVIPDTLADERFATNPLVTGEPFIRFYAGAPLITEEGHALGTLCVIDRKPRTLDARRLRALRTLRDDVMSRFELRRKSAALEATHHRLALIMNATAEGICGADAEGRATFINPAAARLLGWKPHELLGRRMHEIVHHSYADGTPYPKERCPVYAAFKDGTTQQVWGEIFWRKDGTSFPVEYSSTPIERDGELVGALVVFESVAERTQSEASLKESEARKSAMLAAAIDCVITIDHAGKIIEFNPAAEAAFGRTRGAVLGEDLAEKIIPPRLRAAHRKGFTHYLAAGEGPVIGKRIEVPAMRADGTEFPAELTITRIPVDGPPQFTAYLRDITQRKRAEEVLQFSEERYRSLVTATASIVWTAAPNGTIVDDSSSWEAFTGQTSEQYTGSGWLDAVHPEDRERNAETWQSALKNRTAVETEDRLRRRDGQYRHMLLRAVPVFDASGDLREWIGYCTDITERKRTEEERDRFFTLPLHLLCIAGIDGYFKRLNPAFEGTLGFTEKELLARPFFDFVHPEDLETTRAELEGLKGGITTSYFENRYLCKDGSYRWLAWSAFPAVNEGLVYAAALDITERKRSEEQLKFLAHYDSLTDLPNRVLFMDRLGLAVASAARHGRIVAVLLLDLDGFKAVNDTLGHETGDLLSQTVGGRLATSLRDCDTVARLGGDEFAVVLTEIAQRTDASRVAARILKALSESIEVRGETLAVSGSIGIALYPKDGADATSLLKNADAVMYQAKERGRNQYRHYSKALGKRAARRLKLESDLRLAAARGEFLLHYQPQVDLASGCVVAVEALLRWRRADSETLVAPSEFIPALEQTGLIMPVGEWVLRSAAAQVQSWKGENLGPMRVAVNLSARQFGQLNVKKTVDRVLTGTGLDPRYLELELTESLLQSMAVESMLRPLRDAGVRVSIDDFGTGYSSLSYLKRFSIDSLKIDRSFVAGIPADSDNAAIVKAIISMAHSLGLEVTAEGVETVEQLDFLRSLECDVAQGYLISKPLPATELAGWLAEGFRQGSP